MQFIIVTGMSGAGKSTALKFLEDLGFFCADNLPPALIPKFVEVCAHAGAGFERVALGVDIRGGKPSENFFAQLEATEISELHCTILFLDASDEVLLKRYKETRRSHPLARGERLAVGIAREREMLKGVKKQALYILDTSQMLTRQLKDAITDIFVNDKPFGNLMITVMSFGFKYGIPTDSDMVFDVRFIPNPFYIAEMKPLTGHDAPVRDYVMGWEVSRKFLAKTEDMLSFLLPEYVEEGKNQLVISIGCTGGKHRSVTLANALFQSLQKTGNSVIINHRDIDRDAKR